MYSDEFFLKHALHASLTSNSLGQYYFQYLVTTPSVCIVGPIALYYICAFL